MVKFKRLFILLMASCTLLVGLSHIAMAGNGKVAPFGKIAIPVQKVDLGLKPVKLQNSGPKKLETFNSYLHASHTIEAGASVNGTFIGEWGIPVILTITVGATIYLIFIARGR